MTDDNADFRERLDTIAAMSLANHIATEILIANLLKRMGEHKHDAAAALKQFRLPSELNGLFKGDEMSAVEFSDFAVKVQMMLDELIDRALKRS